MQVCVCVCVCSDPNTLDSHWCCHSETAFTLCSHCIKPHRAHNDLKFYHTCTHTDTHTANQFRSYLQTDKITLSWNLSAPWQQPTASLLLRKHQPIRGPASFVRDQSERSVFPPSSFHHCSRWGCGAARLIIPKISGYLKGNTELFINRAAVTWLCDGY